MKVRWKSSRLLDIVVNNKIKTILLIAAFIALIGISAFAYNSLKDNAEPQNSIGSAEKMKAPDFTVTDSNGETVKLSDMLGEPVVLNFWASWCPPCKAEMPDFDKVYKEVGDDIQFMMINTLDRDTVEQGQEFIAGAGYTFPVFFDTNKNEAAANYGIRSYPTSVFIDKDGYIVTGVEGQINEQTLLEGIELIK